MFFCQKCRKEIKVDEEVPLDESAIQEFLDVPLALHLPKDFKKNEQLALDQLAESFVLLPKSGERPISSLDKQVKALEHIIEIASDRSQIDHPLCLPCSDSLAAELDRRLAQADLDRKCFAESLEKLKEVEVPPKEELTPEELKEEEELKLKLADIRKQRQALQLELKALEAESKNLSKYEQWFWEDYQDFQLQLKFFSEEYSRVKTEIKTTSTAVERLRRSNIYDDFFHINADGHFGSITGFRLGRLPATPVEWAETNAALGQMVLVLHVIAQQSKFEFTKYKPIPNGSFSQMRDSSGTKYELYGSNDFSLGKMFWYRRFDQGLVALLECIKEFADYACSQDKEFAEIYNTRAYKIDKESVKVQFNNDPKWTSALKYMLSNLKYLLLWVARNPA